MGQNLTCFRVQEEESVPGDIRQAPQDDAIPGTLAGLIAEASNPVDPRRLPLGISSVRALRRLDFPIPDRVYRSHRGTYAGLHANGLRRSHGAAITSDSYLAAIIEHSGRKCESAGQVLSLTESIVVAYKYRTHEKSLVTITTLHQPGRFRTMVDILVRDADRLMAQRLVRPATVLWAINFLVYSKEKELFYMGGDIPAKWLVG